MHLETLLLMPSLASLPEPEPRRIDEVVRTYAPAWHASRGDALRRGLGLG